MGVVLSVAPHESSVQLKRQYRSCPNFQEKPVFSKAKSILARRNSIMPYNTDQTTVPVRLNKNTSIPDIQFIEEMAVFRKVERR